MDHTQTDRVINVIKIMKSISMGDNSTGYGANSKSFELIHLY